jgi:hypothetical protein
MQRPHSVTVFGILNIAFANIGLVGALAGLIRMKELATNPMVAAMNSSPQFVLWNRIHTPIGFALGIVLLASGIGLLNLKAWARKASIVYAVVVIVSACISTLIFWNYVLPIALERASAQSGQDALVLKVAAYFAAFGGLIAMIYPALLIFFMTRPRIAAAFDKTQPP